jgi:hypothetical protein
MLEYGPTVYICDVDGKWIPGINNNFSAVAFVAGETTWAGDYLLEPSCDLVGTSFPSLRCLPPGLASAPVLQRFRSCGGVSGLEFTVAKSPSWASSPLVMNAAPWSSNSEAQMQLTKLRMYAQFPVKQYRVEVVDSHSAAEGMIATSFREVLAFVEETEGHRHQGSVFAVFSYDRSGIIERFKATHVYTGNPEDGVKLRVWTLSASNESISSDLHTLPIVSASNDAPVAANTLPTVYACERAVASILPQTKVLGSEDIAKNASWLLISDSFPVGAGLVFFSIDFPTAPSMNELVTVSCSLPSAFQDRVFFSPGTQVQYMTQSRFLTNGKRLFFSLYSIISPSFPNGPSLLRGAIHCDVSLSGTVPITDSFPIYDWQRLSVGLIWIKTSWPLFHDIIIEGDRAGSYRSMWDPPGSWNFVTKHAAPRDLELKDHIMSKRRATESAVQNRNDSVPIWSLDESEFHSFLGLAFRTPSMGSLALLTFVSESNITIVSDSLWTRPIGMQSTLSEGLIHSNRTLGPFQSGMSVRFGGIACPIRRISRDGYAVRFTLPSFKATCHQALTQNCITPELSISVPGGIDTQSLCTLASGGPESTTEEVRLLALFAGLPATITSPPFFPALKGEELVPIAIGQDWMYPEVVGITTSEAWSTAANVVELDSIGKRGEHWSRDRGSSGGLSMTLTEDCSLLGYESLSSGRCQKGEVPERGPCAYIDRNTNLCTQCPVGAICPGDHRIFLKPGYWSAGFPYDPDLLRCPEPSEERCPGSNETDVGISAPVVRCGLAYKDGSILCGTCARGYYPKLENRESITSICTRCDFGSSDRRRPSIIFSFSLICLSFAVFGVSFWTSRQYGGSIMGSVKRTVRYILLVFLGLQYLAPLAITARSVPGLLPFLQKMFVAFEKIVFADISVPPECTNAPHFAVERTQMISVIIFFVLFFLATVAWMPVSKLCKLGCKSKRHVWSMKERSSKARFLDFLQCVGLHFLNPVLYRRLFASLIQISFGMVCRTALRVIRCEEDVLLSVPAYLLLNHDGSSLHRAGLSCGSADPLCQQGLTQGLVYRQLHVSVAKWYPDQVCSEGNHKGTRRLAIATLMLVCFVYVALSFVLVEWRISLLLRDSIEKSASKRKCAVRAPCGFFRKTTQTQHQTIARSLRSSEQKSGFQLMKACLLSTCRMMAGDSHAKSKQIMRDGLLHLHDRVDQTPSIVDDPYISSFVDAEFAPSLFYFLHLGFLTIILLHLTATYWDETSATFYRCLCNVFIISATGSVIFFSRPYRPQQAYGQFIQLSFLGVGIAVTFLDFIGNVGSSPDPLNPFVRTTSRAVGAVVSFLGFFVFTLLIILGLSLLLLFFRILIHGARDEQEAFLSKSYRCMAVSVLELAAQEQRIHNESPPLGALIDIMQDGVGSGPSFPADHIRRNPAHASDHRQKTKTEIDGPGDVPNVVNDTSNALAFIADSKNRVEAHSSSLQIRGSPRAGRASGPDDRQSIPVFVSASPYAVVKKSQPKFTAVASFYGPRMSNIIPKKKSTASSLH